MFYAVVGGQSQKTKQGHIAWFYSKNLLDWRYGGILNFAYEPDSYMVECPNLVFVDHNPVLIFCPQGAEVTNNQNIYPNVYILGKNFDFNSGTLINDQKPANIDQGFDSYATQAFSTPDGKTYAISWAGLPDIAYPSDKENWAHCLSLVKELHIKNGRLMQTPVSSLKKLRYHKTTLASKINHPSKNNFLLKDTDNQYELKLTFPEKQFGKLLLAGSKNLKHKLEIDFSTGDKACLSLDRGKTAFPFAQNYGIKRNLLLNANQKLTLDIFIDHSICEIFVNDGKAVLTSRFFSRKEDNNIAISKAAKFFGTYWQIDNM